MILLYTHKITARLNYICHFILKEQLGLDYAITTNKSDCLDPNQIVINYSNEKIDSHNFYIKPHALLFETEIKYQHIQCFEAYGNSAFFYVKDSDLAFDIFAATFYLISRYEEYLPHEKDIFGRYAHENSIAFKNNFLQKPVVNFWIQHFGKLLLSKFPNIDISNQSFKTILTYDIDMAWSFKNKGFLRNLGGFLKQPSLERLYVLFKLKKDPFDSYAFLDQMHESLNLDIYYFFLVANSVNEFDKNISLKRNPMQNLIKHHLNKYNIGLHPSWKSKKNIRYLKDEKKSLESITQEPVYFSRQHYIHYTLPEGYERLIECGIKKDFSMGYGSINGFRASFAGSFYWYNLSKETMTSLKIIPFCFMDANSFYEQDQDAEKSFEEIMHYKNICAEVDGLFVPIFHNNFLGTDKSFAGWREMYAKFISQVLQ